MSELKISLEAARVNANMTQKGVAKAMGVANNTVLAWEKGTTPIKAIQLEALCSLYGVGMNNILLPKNVTKSCKDEKEK